MHFSIPDTQELFAEATGQSYTAYNIYINGTFHASLRYKQLHSLNEQLRKYYLGAVKVSNSNVSNIINNIFPPKKFLPLTPNQIDVRRAGLEHYLQLMGQDTSVVHMPLWQEFWLRAQLETALAEGVLQIDEVDAQDEHWYDRGGGSSGSICNDHSDVENSIYKLDSNTNRHLFGSEFEGNGEFFKRAISLEILLPNDFQVKVNCQVMDNASAVLSKVANCLHLSRKLLNYFGLFLIRKDEKDSLILLRKLMDFESAYISRIYLQSCQIQLRKSYWNPKYDAILFEDVTALNLLYMQTVAEVDREWILCTPEVRERLEIHREMGKKREYMEIVRRLPLYGCLQFVASKIDYPESDTMALIAIGNRELSMRILKSDKIYETKFRVTRMRCWRVITLHGTNTSKEKPPHNLQLSFEYLISKDNLRWITITSPQAMLISVCLQNMVDELLHQKDEILTTELGQEQRKMPNDSDSVNNSVTISQKLNTSGLSTASAFSTSSTSSTTSSASSASSSTSSTPSSIYSMDVGPVHPVTLLSQRILSKHHPKVTSSQSYGAVFIRNSNSLSESVQNEAFDEVIGDDDL